MAINPSTPPRTLGLGLWQRRWQGNGAGSVTPPTPPVSMNRIVRTGETRITRAGDTRITR